jgi:hypothetical protein
MPKRSDWMKGLLYAEDCDQIGEQTVCQQEIQVAYDFGEVTDFDKGAKDYFHNKKIKAKQ